MMVMWRRTLVLKKMILMKIEYDVVKENLVRDMSQDE